MFGWLWKKPTSEPVGSEVEPAPLEPASVPEKAPPVTTPVEPPTAKEVEPAPPKFEAPNVPSAPPSSDDWASLLTDSGENSPVVAPAPKTSSGRIVVNAAPPPRSAEPNTPDLLVVGTQMRAIPEKQPTTPRGWNVKIFKVDAEGIWLARIPGEDDPLPVSPKEVLTLVVFDERQQMSYDCPILKIKAGNPEQVLVGRPLKSLQEKSKLDSIGGRQHYRITTQLPIEVRIPGASGKGIPPMSGHTRDISKGGLALVVNRGFETGRELEVRVLSWNFPLQVKAKVVRCDEEGNGMFVLAVAFPEDMSAITRDLVGHFIMENQRGR